jgi:O-antigen ligase
MTSLDTTSSPPAFSIGRRHFTVSITTVEKAIAVGLLIILGTDILPILFGGFDPEAQTSDSNFKVRVIYLATYALTAALIGWRVGIIEKAILRAPLLVMLLLFPFITYVWSVDPGETLQRAISFFGSSLLGIYLGGRFNLKSLMHILALASGAIALLDLVFVFAIPAIGIMHDGPLAGSWAGTHGHKTGLGKAMSVGAIFSIFAIFSSGARSQIFYAIILSIQLFLLWGAHSLGGAMNFVLIAGFVTLMSLIQVRLYRSFIVACVFALAVGVMALILLSNYGLGPALEAVGKNESMSSRLPLWAEVVDALKTSPILGFGYSAFWDSGLPIVSRIASNLRFVPYYSHNGLLETMLNGGLLLTTYFLAYLGILVAQSLKFLRQGTLLSVFPIVSIMMFIVSNIVESSIMSRNSSSWIVFVAMAFFLSIAVNPSFAKRRAPRLRWRSGPGPANRPPVSENADGEPE